MTPSALTPAARKSTKRPTDTSARSANPKRPAGHRSELRRQVSPRAARRVSGPLGGLLRGRAPGAEAPPRSQTGLRPEPQPRTRPQTKTPPPRAGARTGAQTPARRPRGSAIRARAPWPARSAAYVRALPDHALLDRIVRGRAWIPLLGVLLAGIVAMQVEVLKLNAGIGLSLERSTTLQSQNQLLRANVAQLSDDQRIERMAAKMGMVMAPPQEIKFLATGPAVTGRALTGIHQPNPTGFASTVSAIASAALASNVPQGSATGGASTGTGSATQTQSGSPVTSGLATSSGGAGATPTSGP